jgi:hypothetical protein
MAIDGMLRPHVGLYGCRAAAPPALALSVASHCVALQVVRPWRRCRRLSARPVADLEKVDQGLDLLFKGSSCKCAWLFCILFSCKDPSVILSQAVFNISSNVSGALHPSPVQKNI